MVDSLNGLRHNSIIGSDNDNSDISYFSTTGTHSSKCLMTRSIKESNMSSVFKFDIVSTDMLCYTSSLSCNNIGVADMVEQRGLTMVNMSHNSYDRRTAFQISLSEVGLFFINIFNHLGRNKLGSETELFGYNIYCFCIQALVDTYHKSQSKASGDNLINRDIHHNRQLISSYKLSQFQYF